MRVTSLTQIKQVSEDCIKLMEDANRSSGLWNLEATQEFFSKRVEILPVASIVLLQALANKTQGNGREVFERASLKQAQYVERVKNATRTLNTEDLLKEALVFAKEVKGSDPDEVIIP